MSSYNTTVNIPQGGDALYWGDVAQTGCVRAGKHTVTSAQVTASAATFATGLTTVSGYIVAVLRSNVTVTSDAVITESAGTISVADGGTTYNVTENDVIHWIAVGV